MKNISSRDQTPNPEEATRQFYKNWREQFSIPLLISLLVLEGITFIRTLSASHNLVINLFFIAIFIITGIVTVIPFSYLIRMSVVILGIYVIGLAELSTQSILGNSLFFFLGLIVFSTIFLSPKIGMAALIINIITFILFGWLMLTAQFVPFYPKAAPASISDWLSAGLVISLFGTVTIAVFQRLEAEFLKAQNQIDTTLNMLKIERDNLELTVSDRTRQLDKVNQIGRAVTAILEPDELLRRAAHLIALEFEYYYIAFFLLDSTEQWAELKEATGEAGRILRENRHRLDVNGRSAVGKSIRTKIAHVAQDNSNEFIRPDNPLLPYSRSQIVLPLIAGEKVLGALEMQSTKSNAFTQQEVGTFQSMTNEIAIALENSHLFRESQQSLTEMRAMQRQYLQGSWSSLTKEQNLEYSLGDNNQTNTKDLEISLLLRDQTIGMIHLENSSDWTPEQKNLIESITAQATLALENARLVEESQSVAARERLANELIAKIWASTNMESILQTTVRELGRTLEAAEVVIEVSMEEDNE